MSPTAAPRPRVLSGIQPDFGLHLGNYLGALRNWARDQDRFENYFCIVDLHALTQHPDPERLRSLTLELAAMYIACGLDPDRCEIFVQSHVPAHTQLCWILETLTPMGWLDRMTQFKARIQAQGRERINTGVFTYPVLMAADILLYDADFVPVGEDQRQHIELCRDLANRLNSQRGDVFKVPAAVDQRGGRSGDGTRHARREDEQEHCRGSSGTCGAAARSAGGRAPQDRPRDHGHRAGCPQTARCRRRQPARDLRSPP